MGKHDLALLQTFIQESIESKHILFSYQNLKAHTVCNNNQLIAINEGVIATAPLATPDPTFLVKSGSLYEGLIHRLLIEHSFIPGNRNIQEPFRSYEYFQVPPGYHLNCTFPSELWQAWWKYSRRIQYSLLSTELLIRVRNSWYPIRDCLITEGRFRVKTLGSEIALFERESVLWLNKLELSTTST
ncbi:MAG TPA: hypothetical protein V6C64_13155 [Microcoleaceae cyanobacterium]|jgi:hypothetical protein